MYDDHDKVAALFSAGLPEAEEKDEGVDEDVDGQNDDTADKPRLGRTATLLRHVAGEFARARRSVLHVPERYMAASELTGLPFHQGAAGPSHVPQYTQDPALHTKTWLPGRPLPPARMHTYNALQRTAELNQGPGVGPCSCDNCAGDDHDDNGGGGELSAFEEDIERGRVVVLGFDMGIFNAATVAQLVNVGQWREEYDAFKSLTTVRGTQLREACTAASAHRDRAMLKEKRLFDALDAARACAYVPSDGGHVNRGAVVAQAARNIQITGALLNGFDCRSHRQGRFAMMRRKQAALDKQASALCQAARGVGARRAHIVAFWGDAQFGNSYAGALLKAMMRQPGVTIVKINEANTSARCASCFSYLCKNVYTRKRFTAKSKWTGRRVQPFERARSWCALCQRAHGRDMSAAVSMARRGMLGVVGEEDMLVNHARKGEAHERAVLQRFLLRLGAAARAGLLFAIPATVDGFGPEWTLAALRDAVRVHYMLRARALIVARRQRELEERLARHEQHQPPSQGAARHDATSDVDADFRHVAGHRAGRLGSI